MRNVIKNISKAFIEEAQASPRMLEDLAAMEKYIADGVFTEYKNAMVYVERVQSNGIVRKGLIGAIDLEKYDFSKGKYFDPEDPTQLNAKSYEYYFNKHPEQLLPVLKYTIDEVEQNQDAITMIPNYAKQCLAEFVTGARNIDTDWDSYLEELNSMGLENWLKAAQAAYERTLE